MDNLDSAQIKSSFYCWLILCLVIVGTLIFMVNSYNKAVKEITYNVTVFNNHFNQTLEYDQN